MLYQILESNEKRARKQKALIEEYNNSLISFTLNIPGKIKDKPDYRAIHIEGVRIIEEVLKENRIPVIHREEYDKTTGREAYIVAYSNEYKIKKLMSDIEEDHPLGRIFDIDVFSSKNTQISRSNINKSLRRCLICKKDAIICMREKNHSYDELSKKIDLIFKKYKKIRF